MKEDEVSDLDVLFSENEASRKPKFRLRKKRATTLGIFNTSMSDKVFSALMWMYHFEMAIM